MPRCPPELAYIWRMFWRLRRRKGGTGFGASPVEWPDIDAFVRFARIDLMPFELEMLEMLDDTFLAASAKPESEKDKEI